MLQRDAYCGDAPDPSPLCFRTASFTLSEELAKLLPEIGRLSERELLSQLKARAYAVLVTETGRKGDRRWSRRLGLKPECCAQYRHALLWSQPDQSFRVVVYSIAYSSVVRVLTDGSTEFELYRARMTEKLQQLAKAQANAHLGDQAPPPYEVMISWLAEDGRPIRRLFKLAKLVGAEKGQSPYGHDAQLTAKAMAIAAAGVDVRVTVRSHRSPAQIAVEYLVEDLPSGGHLRWTQSTHENAA